jgi:hypothetical protein
VQHSGHVVACGGDRAGAGQRLVHDHVRAPALDQCGGRTDEAVVDRAEDVPHGVRAGLARELPHQQPRAAHHRAQGDPAEVERAGDVLHRETGGWPGRGVAAGRDEHIVSGGAQGLGERDHGVEVADQRGCDEQNPHGWSSSLGPGRVQGRSAGSRRRSGGPKRRLDLAGAPP